MRVSSGVIAAGFQIKAVVPLVEVVRKTYMSPCGTLRLLSPTQRTAASVSAMTDVFVTKNWISSTGFSWIGCLHHSTKGRYVPLGPKVSTGAITGRVMGRKRGAEIRARVTVVPPHHAH